MKRKIIAALSIAVVFTLMSVSLFGCADSDEMKQAKADFTTQTERISAQEADLDAAISEGDELSATDDKLLDPSLIPALETAVSEAKAAKVEVPSMPSKLDDITAKTEELAVVDYTDETKAVTDAIVAVQDSISKYKLVDQPTEGFVIERLGRISDVSDIAAVTEDNDPNGQLNKSGGYTATVYFTSPLVDQSKLYKAEGSVIDKGTEGGGAVEVYRTPEEAQKRCDYLANFDGSVFSSGSHKVIGTCLVRTSGKLTASQQNALEAEMVDALTQLS